MGVGGGNPEGETVSKDAGEVIVFLFPFSLSVPCLGPPICYRLGGDK